MDGDFALVINIALVQNQLGNNLKQTNFKLRYSAFYCTLFSPHLVTFVAIFRLPRAVLFLIMQEIGQTIEALHECVSVNQE